MLFKRRWVRSCIECYEWSERQRQCLEEAHRLVEALSRRMKPASSMFERLSSWLLGLKCLEEHETLALNPNTEDSLDGDSLFDADDTASELSTATTTTRRRRARGKARPASVLRRQVKEARNRALGPSKMRSSIEPKLTRAALAELEQAEPRLLAPLAEEDHEPPTQPTPLGRMSCADLAARLRASVNARRWTTAERLLRLDALLLPVDLNNLSTTNLGRATARLSRDTRVPGHVRRAAAAAVDAWRALLNSQSPAFSPGDAVLYYADPTTRACLDATVLDVKQIDKTTFRYVVAVQHTDSYPDAAFEVDDVNLEPKPLNELASL